MLKEHNWHQLKDDTAQRLNQLAPYFRDGKIIDAKDTVAALEAVIRSFDRVNIEGNNQKQADFLSECLCQLDPQKDLRPAYGAVIRTVVQPSGFV